MVQPAEAGAAEAGVPPAASEVAAPVGLSASAAELVVPAAARVVPVVPGRDLSGAAARGSRPAEAGEAAAAAQRPWEAEAAERQEVGAAGRDATWAARGADHCERAVAALWSYAAAAAQPKEARAGAGPLRQRVAPRNSRVDARTASSRR